MFRDHKSYRTLTEAEKGKRSKGRQYGVKQPNISDTRYECDICDKDWMSEIDVEIHRRHKHGKSLLQAAKVKKNFMCSICFRRQSSKENLIKHIKVVHFYSSPNAKKIERDIFFCNLCGKMLFNKTLLAWHIFHSHSGVKDARVQLDCVTCIIRSPRGKLWQHTLLHNFSSFTTCPFCFENTEDQHELHQHISKHNYLLRCDICLFDAKSRESYEKHLLEHSRRSSNNIKNFGKYFITSIEPVYHVERWLKGLQIPEGIFICILCREICTDQKSRQDHILIDHGNVNVTKNIYMCACGEDFFNAMLLRHHVWKMKGSHRRLGDEEIKDYMDKRKSLLNVQNLDDDEIRITENMDQEDSLLELQVVHDEQTKRVYPGNSLIDIRDLEIDEAQGESSDMVYVVSVESSP